MAKFKYTLLFSLVLILSTAFMLPSRPKRPSTLGKRLIEALANKDFKQIAALQPGIVEWKVLVPDQTEGLSDEEIEAKMDAGNTRKLKNAYDEVIAAGRAKKVKFKLIEFNEVIVKRYYEDKRAPVGLEVMFFYDHYSGKVQATAVEQEGEWFLLEINEGATAFQDVPEQAGGLLNNFQFKP